MMSFARVRSAKDDYARDLHSLQVLAGSELVHVALIAGSSDLAFETCNFVAAGEHDPLYLLRTRTHS